MSDRFLVTRRELDSSRERELFATELAAQEWIATRTSAASFYQIVFYPNGVPELGADNV
jgi:hypothetical protein